MRPAYWSSLSAWNKYWKENLRAMTNWAFILGTAIAKIMQNQQQTVCSEKQGHRLITHNTFVSERSRVIGVTDKCWKLLLSCPTNLSKCFTGGHLSSYHMKERNTTSLDLYTLHTLSNKCTFTIVYDSMRIQRSETRVVDLCYFNSFVSLA